MDEARRSKDEAADDATAGRAADGDRDGGRGPEDAADEARADLGSLGDDVREGGADPTARRTPVD